MKNFHNEILYFFMFFEILGTKTLNQTRSYALRCNTSNLEHDATINLIQLSALRSPSEII